MARHAKAIDLVKGHKSNEELARRRANEEAIRIRDKVILPSDDVMQDQLALKYFNHMKKVFACMESFYALPDELTVNRYCMAHADYDRTRAYYTRGIISQRIEGKTINRKFNFNERITLSNQVDKKGEILIKYEDRMFLNPLSRYKSIPPKAPEPKKNPMTEEFDV